MHTSEGVDRLRESWAPVMPTLAAYAAMMERDRRREGLRVCRAAWLIGVSVREYREIEAGHDADPGDVPTDLQALRVAADVR